MDYFVNFITSYFPLICVVVGMSFIAIFDARVNKATSYCILGILAVSLSLAIIVTFEQYGKDTVNVMLTTVMSVLGYTFRPIAVFLFILMGNDGKFKKLYFAGVALLLFNFLVFGTGLFINTDMKYFAVSFILDDTNTSMSFNAGPMRYTCHIVSGILLVYLLFESLGKIRLKHSRDSYAIIVCALAIVAAVAIESNTESGPLLNNTIAVSCMFYYLFLLNTSIKKDSLTGLFERRTFFIDANRYNKKITAIIQIDMNGLKIINDTRGHKHGDNGLIAIGKAIDKHMSRTMYGYRIGGDEFIVLSLGDTPQRVEQFKNDFKNDLASVGKYSASIGVAYRQNKDETFNALMKSSEADMYIDKQKYYQENHIERRKNRTIEEEKK